MDLKMSREDVCELIEDSTEIAKGEWRWGATTTYVYVRDGKHYMFVVRRHVTEGLQHEDGETIRLREVTAQKKEITEWVEVPT